MRSTTGHPYTSCRPNLGMRTSPPRRFTSTSAVRPGRRATSRSSEPTGLDQTPGLPRNGDMKQDLTVDISNKPGVFSLRVRAHGPHSARAERARTAAAYRVASELECIAGAESLSYAVDASCAREGVVLVHVAEGGLTVDVMCEICIEAAPASGLGPTVD